MGSQDKERHYRRDVIFDEKSILQEKSETKDKMQDGALDSSAGTQKKEVKFSESLKRPEESEKDSSDLDGENRKLLKSNLNRGGGQ